MRNYLTIVKSLLVVLASVWFQGGNIIQPWYHHYWTLGSGTNNNNLMIVEIPSWSVCLSAISGMEYHLAELCLPLNLGSRFGHSRLFGIYKSSNPLEAQNNNLTKQSCNRVSKRCLFKDGLITPRFITILESEGQALSAMCCQKTHGVHDGSSTFIRGIFNKILPNHDPEKGRREWHEHW